MNDNIFHNGQDTGLNWKDAPEWANVIISCLSFDNLVWAAGWELPGAVKAIVAQGDYSLDRCTFHHPHNWTLVSTRPQEEPWQIGDELEFLGNGEYETKWYTPGKIYTITSSISDSYCTWCISDNVDEYHSWSENEARKMFKRINKTKEEQKVTEMKSVRDVDHLEELMNKGVEITFYDEKVLSIMKKPEGCSSVEDVVVFTNKTWRLFYRHTISTLKYKPTKIRRFYQTGDRKEDIIHVNDHNDKIVALYDLSTDYPDADYPVTLIVRETGGKFFNTFNKDQIIVEVEE